MGKSIIIVGGGIIGSATAFRLQQAGASVTLVDAGIARATDASFGWINASFFLNQDHFRLRAEGIAAYARLAADLDVPVTQMGCLMWDLTGQAFDDCRDQLMSYGYPCTELDSGGFATLEPAVAHPPQRSLHFTSEAVADSTALADRLLAAAQSLGAKVVAGTHVIGMSWGDKGVTVATDAGPLNADDVIIAAGTGTQAICAGLGIPMPMLRRPAYVIETQPVPHILSHVLASPIGEIRQRRDGSLLIPASVSHQADSAETLDQSATAAADATTARLQTLLPDHTLHWAKVTRANRPVPGDNLPVMGRIADGPYVAVMHSGLTLAAIAAELITRETTSGPSNTTNAQLAPFRPGRFA